MISKSAPTSQRATDDDREHEDGAQSHGENSALYQVLNRFFRPSPSARSAGSTSTVSSSNDRSLDGHRVTNCSRRLTMLTTREMTREKTR